MEIPIRKVVFNKDNPDLGLEMISLVENPANEIERVLFSTQEEIKLSIQDAEKCRFICPVLIPDQLIPRKDNAGNAFYLTFDAETIKEVAYDWQKKHLSGKVDINHSRKLIEGVHYVETFLSNENTVSSVKGFEKLKAGTWFVVAEAHDPEVRKKIESGEISGVSIDGFFGTESVKMEIEESVVKKIIQNFSHK